MDRTPLIKWLNEKLSVILECQVGDEYCKNILNMSRSEIESLIKGLIDTSVQKNKIFLDELLNRLSSPSSLDNKEFVVYKKPEIKEDSHRHKDKSRNKEQHTSVQESSLKKHEAHKPKKFEATSLSADYDADRLRVPGRHPCDCQASKHKLISNCLKCGRIICEQEGSGPCLFCGNLVCTKQEFEKINSGSRKGEILKQQLLSKAWEQDSEILDAGLSKAIAHKDKLIEFDRNCTKRTRVIDDEADYFQSGNRWLNKDQRDKLNDMQKKIDEKRFGSKLQSKTYTFDIFGKKVIEDRENINFDEIAHEIEKLQNNENKNQQIVFNKTNENPNNLIERPIFSLEDNQKASKVVLKENNKNKNKKSEIISNAFRLQDKELQELKDDGHCLTMHQPWASLLVLGIKKHEGRTWYTPYRGRLWIHAASKQPTNEDIQSVEMFYKNLFPDKKFDFPTSYPTSCLLGYVDLVDCMPEDVYKEQYPTGGEYESPYVFIVENPFELLVKVPMSGQHKIFKLDKNVFNTARKTAVLSRS